MVVATDPCCRVTITLDAGGGAGLLPAEAGGHGRALGPGRGGQRGRSVRGGGGRGDASVFNTLVPSDEWSGGSDGSVTLVPVAAIRYATRRGGGRADGHRLTVIQSARQGAAGHSTGRFKVQHKYVDVHVRDRKSVV